MMIKKNYNKSVGGYTEKKENNNKKSKKEPKKKETKRLTCETTLREKRS